MKSLNQNKDVNFENLLIISKILNNFEHFIFYGTLLGMTRERGIINGDDDIDILINHAHKNRVINKMKNCKFFKINKKVSNEYFVQFTNKNKGQINFIDFYFYINNPKKNYLIEKHNFLSSIFIDRFSLHIPKKIIFPIKKDFEYNQICLPKSPRAVCQFLYGKNWKKPLKKNSGYRMEIVNNKPIIVERSFLGSITRRVKEYFLNEFKKK